MKLLLAISLLYLCIRTEANSIFRFLKNRPDVAKKLEAEIQRQEFDGLEPIGKLTCIRRIEIIFQHFYTSVPHILQASHQQRPTTSSSPINIF